MNYCLFDFWSCFPRPAEKYAIFNEETTHISFYFCYVIDVILDLKLGFEMNAMVGLMPRPAARFCLTNQINLIFHIRQLHVLDLSYPSKRLK